MGAIALLVTIFYTFLPCFLFVFIGAPWIEKSGESQLVRSVLKFITAAVVAAILQLTVFLVHGVLFPAGSRSPYLWAAVCVICAFLLIHLNSQRMSRNPIVFLALEGTVLRKQKSLHPPELRGFRFSTSG